MPRASYIEQAAADFGRHSKGGGGWALGLAVAACVEPGTGNGRPGNRSDRAGFGKVSATEFARQSGTSKDRVMRYLKAWQNAAEQHLVAPADELTPADWADPDHIPTGHEWDEFYDASAAGSRPRDSRPEHVAQIIERRGVQAVVEALTVDQVDDVVEAVARRHPKVAQNAVSRAAAASLPEAPFATPPEMHPGAASDEARMDIQRDVANVHDAIGRIERWLRTHREMVTPHADRLDSEAEQLHMVAEAARGLSDDTLARILDGEDDLR